MVSKTRGYVGNVLNGKQNVGLEFIYLVISVFPDIDLNWLLKDEYIQEEHQDIVNESKVLYSKKDTCKECLTKDKLIDRYEKLSQRQENEIHRLEAELLSLKLPKGKTG